MNASTNASVIIDLPKDEMLIKIAKKRYSKMSSAELMVGRKFCSCILSMFCSILLNNEESFILKMIVA